MHLAHHHKLVAVGAYGSVVIEAVTELGVTANHVGGLGHDARHRVVDTTPYAGDLRPRGVDGFFLRVVHHHHARIDPLADHGTGRNSAVAVEQFDPIVVDYAGTARIVFTQPNHRSTSVQRQHVQVVAVGAVDAPFLVWRDEIEGNFLVAVRTPIEHLVHRLQVHRWAVGRHAFAKGLHPRMVQIELLTARQRAPRNVLVHVGVTRVVRHFFALQTRPGGRADDLARLRLNVAKTDFFIFAMDGQVRVVAAGDFSQRLPSLHRHMAIGLGGQLQHHLAGINVGFDFRHALCHTCGMDFAIELSQLTHFIQSVPANALAAVAHLFQQRSQCRKALVDIGVIAFDDGNLRRGHARNQFALTLAPLFHVQGLRQFGGRVVHQGRQHQFFFNAQMAYADFTEGFGKSFVYFPIALALPGRVHRCGQRVNEGVHVTGVEIVLFIPSGRGQHDVRVQTGGAHAKVQRHQQVELAFRRLVMPLHFFGFGLLGAQVFALHAVRGTQQMLEKIFVTFA